MRHPAILAYNVVSVPHCGLFNRWADFNLGTGCDRMVLKNNPRYQANPGVFFLERLVLECIGELSKKAEGELVDAQGKKWAFHLRRLLPLPCDLDEKLRSLWKQNVKLDAEHFAQEIIRFIPQHYEGDDEIDWEDDFRREVLERKS